MRICVAGEGIFDVGWDRDRDRPEGPEYAGDVPLILARLIREHLGRDRRFACLRWTKDDLPRVHPSTAEGWPRPPAEARARELQAALWAASREEGIDALVFVRDSRLEDHDLRLRKCREVLRACDSRGSPIAVVLGLAVQEIEAWLLADPQARAAAFGDAGRNGQYPAPEELPDPKSCWRTLLGESAPGSPASTRDADCRTRAIEAMRPRVVSELCSRGFEPFQKQVAERIVPRLRPERVKPKDGGA
ncbi:MAG: hypothetical protein QME96_01885 [Myxococcota bacterium]|nr:hypothetical protein [Myxococcota bacterium]